MPPPHWALRFPQRGQGWHDPFLFLHHKSWLPPPKALALSNHQCPPPPISLGPSLPDQWGDVAETLSVLGSAFSSSWWELGWFPSQPLRSGALG